MSIFMEDSNVQSDIHSLRKYHTMAQSQGETAALYIQRVQQHREFVESRKFTDEEKACSIVIGGLDPKRYGNFMSTLQVTKTTTVQDLAKSLAQFEASEALNSDTRARTKALQAHESDSPYSTVNKETAKLIKDLTAQVKKLSDQKPSPSQPKDKRKCFNCNKLGHIAPNCPEPSKREVGKAATTNKKKQHKKPLKKETAKVANAVDDDDSDDASDSDDEPVVQSTTTHKKRLRLRKRGANKVLLTTLNDAVINKRRKLLGYLETVLVAVVCNLVLSFNSLFELTKGLQTKCAQLSVELSISILCSLFSSAFVSEKALMIRLHAQKRSRKSNCFDTEVSPEVLRMIADSGCTAHMADISPSALEDFVRSAVTVDTAGTETLYSEGFGAYGPLGTILSVRGLSDSLFSIYAACRGRKTVVFTCDSVKIFDDAQVNTFGEPLLQGKVENKQYILNVRRDHPNGDRERAFVADVSVPNRFTLWHQRLLHMSSRTLEVMHRKSIANGLEKAFTKKDVKLHKQCLCSACCVGKMHMKGQRKKPKPVPTGHDYAPGQVIFYGSFSE